MVVVINREEQLIEVGDIIRHKDLVITGLVTFIVDESEIIAVFQDWIDWEEI